MTPEEAMCFFESVLKTAPTNLYTNSSKVAIIALKKQIPKKPTESDLKIRYCEVFKCPTCGFEFSGRVAKYCYRCGQALDWGDME